MAKPARAVISVRKPPPVDPDTFVKEGATALKRHDSKGAKVLKHSSAKASKRQPKAPVQPAPVATSSTTYVRKGDGVVLKRANLWLPHDVKKALMIHAATNERDPSDVTTEAICKLLGLTWPREAARG